MPFSPFIGEIAIFAFNFPPKGWAADGAGIATQYAASANAQQMSSRAIGMTGGNGPHNNIMPVLTLNFCIALQGVFPARN